MKSINILSIFVVVALARKPFVLGFIDSGIDADISSFPYQVSIQVSQYHACDASVIGDRWVLTAAHCIAEKYLNLITIRAGSTIKNKGGLVFKAVELFVHPEYKKGIVDYDVGLVLVDRVLDGANIKAVSLPSSGAELKDKGAVSGWGFGIPETLQYAVVKIIDQEQCVSDLKPFKSVHVGSMSFCAAGKGCNTNKYGSPIIDVDGVQIGVSVWGVNCGSKKYPGVYARLADPNIRSWISNVANI